MIHEEYMKLKEERKHGNFLFKEYDIGMTEHRFHILPVSNPSCPKGAAQQNLDFRIFVFYSAHVPMSLLGSMSVHIASLPLL